MEIGIDSFVMVENLSSKQIDDGMDINSQSVSNFLDRIELADNVGLDSVGVGEHHRPEFLDSANHMILAAAASRTRNIRLSSAVTVLSAADPVRVFQNYATLDLISNGRAEIVAGRGSFTEAFPLFGYDTSNYSELFSEKIELLLKLRDEHKVTWSGNFRAPLLNQDIYPRPKQEKLPIWIGVGGTPKSFIRAGVLGVPLMIAIIGGETRRFKPLVDMYRLAWREAGHTPGEEKVGLHELGYVAETTEKAKEQFYPGYKISFDQIARERGGHKVTKEAFEYQTAEDGAFLVGSPEDLSEKILRHSEQLGGVDRINIHMDIAKLSHEHLSNAIELLGKAREIVNQNNS